MPRCFLFVCAFWVACAGTDGRTPDGPAVAQVIVEPAAAEIVVVNGVAQPGPVEFTARVVYSDGTSGAPAEGEVRWTLDRVTLASLDARGKLSPLGTEAGEGTVTATVGGQRGNASIRVRVEQALLGPGVPPSAPADFAGVPPTNASPDVPVLRYPLEGALMPSSVKAPDVQWEGGVAGDLFRVTVQAGLAKVEGFVAFDAPGFAFDWLVDPGAWELLKRSAGAQPISVIVDRLTAGILLRSAAVTFRVVGAKVTGAIYYWDLSEGKILRITGGGRDNPIPLPPVKTAPGEGQGSRCVACHTVSRNGQLMAVGLWGGGDFGAIFDLSQSLMGDPAPTVLPPDKYRALFTTFSPDAKRLLVNIDTRLELRDTASGALLTTMGTPLPDSKAAHPTWSPDGGAIALITNHDGGWAVDFTVGDLAVIPVTGPDTFGPATVIRAAEGKANSWPSFSPDGKWIAFGRGDHSRSRLTPQGQPPIVKPGALWLIGSTGGTPVELTQANGGQADSYLPNFSPFDEGGYFWLAFYSTRDYGNAQAGTRGTGRRQLWVTAVGNQPGATDPSHVPFWLPDQDPKTDNMSAYWTLEAKLQ